jgi:hypothetical protein
VARLIAACMNQTAGAGRALMRPIRTCAGPACARRAFLSRALGAAARPARLATAARDADALPLGSGAVAGTAIRWTRPPSPSPRVSGTVGNSIDLVGPISSPRSCSPPLSRWST